MLTVACKMVALAAPPGLGGHFHHQGELLTHAIAAEIATDTRAVFADVVNCDKLPILHREREKPSPSNRKPGFYSLFHKIAGVVVG